jgi:hypothetical protein
MANQTLLTYGFDASQIKQDYYAPSLVLSGTTSPTEAIYCFLSQVLPWTDDNNPDVPLQTQKYLKNVYKSMFVAKKISTNNITPVAQRIDWSANTNYSYYRDDVDMFARSNTTGLLVKNFYVKNRYDQVFKCLANNNGGLSNTEPFFQPGTYNTNQVFTSGPDNYKWKYIYTIDIGTKTKFMDSDWIPVPVGSQTPNATTTAGTGNIDAIILTNGGTNYEPSNTTITITGDGSGATANLTFSSGVITDVNIFNPGSNYTYANVSITSANTQASNAAAYAPVSPIGGHGYDPVSELGCNHIMYITEFNSTETLNGVDYIPIDIDYRQVGLLINPMSSDTYPAFANGSIYDLSTQITVASGFGVYTPDETVVQIDINPNNTTYGQVVFTATVLSFNTSTNVIKLINTSGTITTSASIQGQTSGTTRTLLASTTPKFMKFSGYIAYIQNRSAVQRSADGIEQFKFVLGY